MVNGKMEDKQFEKHLNKYPVISLDITDFKTKYGKDEKIVSRIQEDVIEDLLVAYPDTIRKAGQDLMDVLLKIYEATGEKFIIIIDEWDAICREFDKKPEVMNDYVNLLRRLFKGGNSERVFAGVYMTGILPIKKYKTESALNNFEEYSMIDPFDLAGYFGFTQDEVKKIAAERGADMNELQKWYDGYQIGDEPSMYNPYSVMKAIDRGRYNSYWSATGAYDSVSNYINMNFEGLKDDIIYMLGGGRCDVETTGFDNDPNKIKSKDDVLTILIHLGYLSYDKKKEQCFVPNKEVSEELGKAVRACNWAHVSRALEASKKLLKATLNMNAEAVARGIELTHDEETSILSYNDENSLACVLSIAYYYAKNDYIMHRELIEQREQSQTRLNSAESRQKKTEGQLATGKGFADIVFIPRRNVDSPALLIELKCNRSADAAIDQIKRKEYPAKVAEYTGDILLVGINYDRETKTHTCRIERYTKE